MHCTNISARSEQELSTICWIYPLCGIPMEAPVENSLGVIQCEAGCQLEKNVDVLLTGCVPGNQDQKGAEGVCQYVVFTFLFFSYWQAVTGKMQKVSFYSQCEQLNHLLVSLIIVSGQFPGWWWKISCVRCIQMAVQSPLRSRAAFLFQSRQRGGTLRPET